MLKFNPKSCGYDFIIFLWLFWAHRHFCWCNHTFFRQWLCCSTHIKIQQVFSQHLSRAEWPSLYEPPKQGAHAMTSHRPQPTAHSPCANLELYLDSFLKLGPSTAAFADWPPRSPSCAVHMLCMRKHYNDGCPRAFIVYKNPVSLLFLISR